MIAYIKKADNIGMTELEVRQELLHETTWREILGVFLRRPARVSTHLWMGCVDANIITFREDEREETIAAFCGDTTTKCLRSFIKWVIKEEDFSESTHKLFENIRCSADGLHVIHDGIYTRAKEDPYVEGSSVFAVYRNRRPEELVMIVRGYRHLARVDVDSRTPYHNVTNLIYGTQFFGPEKAENFGF